MADNYSVAIIGRSGRGNYGHGLDTAWNDFPNVKIIAVADDNKSGLAAKAEQLQVSKSFTDYRKMLDETKPDLVAICPRWVDQHRDMAVAAAQRGIHVYLEKPFCRTLAEADEIIATCERSHVKLAIAHPTRYSPKLQTVKRLIASGTIGNLLEFRARGKEDRRGGGEDLWVLGTHVLDMIQSIAGKPLWCHATVTFQGKPISKANTFEGPEGLGLLGGDAVHATFGLKNGTVAYFNSVKNMRGNPSRYGLQIFGSTGILELLEGTMPSVKFLGDSSWSPGRSGKHWQDVSTAGVGKPEPMTDQLIRNRHYLAIQDFLTAIEADRQPIGNPYAGRDVIEMIAAVFESQRIGGPVELPLKHRGNPLERLS